MRDDSQSIKSRLADAGIGLRKCPRYSDSRRFVREETGEVLGCGNASTASAFLRGLPANPCTCGKGPDEGRY